MFNPLYLDEKPDLIDTDEFIAAMKSDDKQTMLDAFARGLLGALDHFKGCPIEPVTLNAIRSTCAYFFRLQLAEYGVQLHFAEGAIYVGAEPFAVPAVSSIALYWQLDFWPGPRWIFQSGCMPLGYHNEYDLYLDYAIKTNLRVIARCSNREDEFYAYYPNQYATFPHDCPLSARHALHEASLRASLAGYSII
jgi:hypothetical protein